MAFHVSRLKMRHFADHEIDTEETRIRVALTLSFTDEEQLEEAQLGTQVKSR